MLQTEPALPAVYVLDLDSVNVMPRILGRSMGMPFWPESQLEQRAELEIERNRYTDFT